MILFLKAWLLATICFVSADRDAQGEFLIRPPNHEKKEKGGEVNDVEEQNNSHLAQEHASRTATTSSHSMSSFTWVPYGEDISLGHHTDDNTLITEFSLSGQGDRIAVTTMGPQNTEPGVVKVFDYSNSTVSSWTQVGNDLVGQGPYDGELGLSLSSNGEILALGAHHYNNFHGSEVGNVRIFQKTSNTNLWVKMGVDILGESKYELSGRSVSLSDDGKTLAIGSPGRDGISGFGDTSEAKMYKFKNGVWSQTGSSIYGETQGDSRGTLVSLAGDGKTVAIASDHKTIPQVRIFRQWANSKWTQIGKPIQGGVYREYPISLSQDGDTFAVGTPEGNINTYIGYVRVFRLVKGNWKKLGKTLSSQKRDNCGWDVELSDNGNVLAIGCPQFSQQLQIGYVRVYHFVFGEWNQVGDDIFGSGSYSNFGANLNLSADGSIFATNDQGSSLVRVFKLDSNIAFGCKDSPLIFKTTDENAQSIKKKCTWVGKTNAKSRCSITGVSETCPATCDTCSSCEDSPLRVKVKFGKNKKRKWRDCTWAAKKSLQRCTKKEIAETCRLTCGTCSP